MEETVKVVGTGLWSMFKALNPWQKAAVIGTGVGMGVAADETVRLGVRKYKARKLNGSAFTPEAKKEETVEYTIVKE